ncbi:MAG: tRNA (adenosine(37)-N6)-threonylcarbamoyltransferase complex dimerization subunit type 1 TsaB [Clostridia bacterium]|nr:tRNA (adenosine(37)-N6)-threonylcarbamoyltransferase complex dimerization subunit type 1 TsaB [Clostridia bacterium]
MLILAIDTSCANAGVCLMRDGNVLGTVSQADKRTHSVKLLPEIQALMESHGVAPAEPDLFAVTTGPGSFTGVRIGAATAKMLAYAAGKPLVGVNTLDVLAGDIDGDGYVLSLIDARNLRAYGRLYRGGRQLTPGAVDKVTALIGALPEEVRGKKIIVRGDAVLNPGICAELAAAGGFEFVPESDRAYPDPAVLAAMAGQIFDAAGRDAARFAPEKLRIEYMKDW